MSARSRAFQRTNERQKQHHSNRSGGRRYDYTPKPGMKGSIIFLRPIDDIFYVGRSHWWRGEKVCTATLEAFGCVRNKDGAVVTYGKCVYCHEQRVAGVSRPTDTPAQRAENAKRADNLRARTQTRVQLIDCSYYHFVPSEKKDDTTDAVPCLNPGKDVNPRASRCPHCANPKDDIRARHFGGKKRWTLGQKMYNQIKSLAADAELTCMHVSASGELCGKGLFAVALDCAQCGEEIMGERDLQTLGQKELDDALERKFECGACGTIEYPNIIMACEDDSHEALPASLYDYQYAVSYGGETKKIRNKDVSMLTANFVPTLLDDDTAQILMDRYGVSKEDAEIMTKADDLYKILRPEFLKPEEYGTTDEYVAAVLAKQAESLEVENPYIEDKKLDKASTDKGEAGAPERTRPFTRRS